MNDASEHWLPVAGWEGLYEVSDLGQVRSLDRTIRYRDGRVRLYPGQVLKQNLHPAGYPYIGLSRDGKTTQHLVHWLVAAAFLGPRPAGLQTLHGPGGPQDNRVANLSYGTPAQNNLDRWRDGTQVEGSMCPGAKLTEDIVRECRVRYAAGEMIKSLAAEFGVNTSTMNVAIHGKTWKHVAA